MVTAPVFLKTIQNGFYNCLVDSPLSEEDSGPNPAQGHRHHVSLQVITVMGNSSSRSASRCFLSPNGRELSVAGCGETMPLDSLLTH